MEQELPSSLTLAEARRCLIDKEAMDPIMGVVKLDRVIRIRFVRLPEETDLPDQCTMGDFRALAEVGKARIVIDDQGEGGFKVKEPELTQ